MTRSCLIVTMLGTLVIACQRGELDPPTCNPNAVAITDSSIGPLLVGESIAALRVRCNAVTDTTVIVPMVGWVDTVAAKRLVVGGVPVMAMFEGDRVTALRVANPGLSTSDGISVGTSVARFKNTLGIRVSPASHSPRAVLQDRSHCGISFMLSGWGSANTPGELDPPVTRTILAQWPDSIIVSSIIVSGCRNRSSNTAVDSAFDAQEDSLAAQSHALQQLPAPAITPGPSNIPAPGVLPLPAQRADIPPIVAAPNELAELRRQMVIPVQGIVRSQLRDTYAEPRGGRVHEALDIPAPRGTPVLAASDGTLLKLFDSKAGGLMVYASDPDDRFILLYGHLDRYADGLRDGMPLERGQVIGYVGTSGNAPIGTPHLHFAILRGRPSVAWWRGTAVNPYPLFAR